MIEGRTFLDYCILLKGYRFYNKKGFEVYKWELFWNDINPYKLISNKTKFKSKIRKDG